MKRLLPYALLLIAVPFATFGGIQSSSAPLTVPLSGVTPTSPPPAFVTPRTLLGRSGAIRVAYTFPGEPLDVVFGAPSKVAYRWRSARGGEEFNGDGMLKAPEKQGVWNLHVSGSKDPIELALITQVRLSERRGGYLNGYHIGTWPAEHADRTGTYAPPQGLIEVTQENQDLHVSAHFQLKHFLTKDQRDKWPKYLALDLRLVDKLELILQELNAMGYDAKKLHVMSGFRTPQYNGPGGNGRAKFSRHTYGDASDVWVDSDDDGYMDDLNGDGKRDTRDAQIIVEASTRVEAKYPELVGGAGIYKANRAHGPFVHIDARGRPARWSHR